MYTKNKRNDEDEMKLSVFIIIIIAIISSSLIYFFIEKFKAILIASIIVLIIPLLVVKEKNNDEKFPYLYWGNKTNPNKAFNLVITFIYTLINNSGVIFALYGIYILALLNITGEDSLRKIPNLDDIYIVQQYIDDDTVILFDDDFTYKIDLIKSNNKTMNVGEKVKLNLSNNDSIKLIEVNKK